jgi:hypothetical protein
VAWRFPERRKDPRTKANLGVRVQRRTAAAVMTGRDVVRAARARVPAPKPFGLAVFKRDFLQNLQLKCYKGSTAKL